MVGAKEVLVGTLSGGELGQFVLYTMLVGVAAGSLSEVWGEVQRAAGAMERLTELLNIQSNIQFLKYLSNSRAQSAEQFVLISSISVIHPEPMNSRYDSSLSILNPENMWHSSVPQVLEKVLFSNCYSDFMTRSQVELPLMASYSSCRSEDR